MLFPQNWLQEEVRGSLFQALMVLWRKYSKMYENSCGEKQKEKRRTMTKTQFGVRLEWGGLPKAVLSYERTRAF